MSASSPKSGAGAPSISARGPIPYYPTRVVIVVDDGIATGATTRAALRAVRKQKPSKLVLAVPVAPTRTLAELKGEADEIVCLEPHDVFFAIGFFYADFNQVSDGEVKEILAAVPADTAVPAATT